MESMMIYEAKSVQPSKNEKTIAQLRMRTNYKPFLVL